MDGGVRKSTSVMSQRRSEFKEFKAWSLFWNLVIKLHLFNKVLLLLLLQYCIFYFYKLKLVISPLEEPQEITTCLLYTFIFNKSITTSKTAEVNMSV